MKKRDNRQKRRPVIKVCEGDLHILADQAEQALIDAEAPIFVGSGLVRPVVEEMLDSDNEITLVAQLKEVTYAYLLDQLSKAAKWVKWNPSKQKNVMAKPPREVVLILLAREGEWRFRRLSGIITTPTLRRDGTVLATPGYDEKTRLLLMSPPVLPEMPSHPTKEDALAALEVLEGLLSEFAFVDAGSRSVALSGMLSSVVRAALSAVPLHAFKAPTAGTGKSYLVDVLSVLSTGQKAPVITPGSTPEETEKRVAAVLLTGQSIIHIDNLNGKLGGEALCQMIERPLVSIRIIATSKNVTVQNRSSFFANGNNIQFVGDLPRRVILGSLDSNLERPELRLYEHDPVQEIWADRGKFIAAALTVVRAYALAGHPDILSPLNSFNDWSRSVRSALVWLGRADPTDTMVSTRKADPATNLLTDLFEILHSEIGSKALTVGEIIDLSKKQDANGSLLQDILAELTGVLGEEINKFRLGHMLRKYDGVVMGELKLLGYHDKNKKQQRWQVVRK